MKIFKYWASIDKEIKINKNKFIKKFFYGSNISFDDANNKLKSNIDLLINNFINKYSKSKDKNNDIDYEINILEPIEKIINDDNYITRNSYGSLVWCSKNILILDIDLLYDVFFDDFYKKFNLLEKLFLIINLKTPSIKEKENFNKEYNNKLDLIIQKFNLQNKDKRVSQLIYLINNLQPKLNFKLYLTNRGIRAIECSQYFNPKDIELQEFMEKIQVDSKYKKLTFLQNCFRARISPKPWRIKKENPRFIFPLNLQTNEYIEQYNNWVNEYSKNIKNLSICKEIGFINDHFNISFNEDILKLIEIHDKYCLQKTDRLY